MKLKPHPPWPANYRDAVALQNRLRRLVRVSPLPRVRVVAAADVSYDDDRILMHAAVIVMRLPSMEIIEQQTASIPVTFPYIPGLLTFREAPAVVEAFRKVETVPDAVIIDGHGLAHMRGMGIASALGLLLGIPTVGCAKSLLVGTHRPLAQLRRCRRTPLRYKGRVVGTVLCTRDGVSPVYVSAGHLSDIASGVRLVLRCTRGYRLAQPIRAAHAAVTKLRIKG